MVSENIGLDEYKDKEDANRHKCKTWNNNEYSIGYLISIYSMRKLRKNAGRIIGYVSKENANFIIENDYCIDTYSCIESIPPEIYAEMEEKERKRYVKMCYVDCTST